MPKNIDFQKFPPSQFSSDSSLDENSGSEGKFRTFNPIFSAGWQWTWKYFLFSAWPRFGPENILRRLYDYLKYALPDLEKQIQLFHFHHTNRYFLVSFKLFDQKSEASTINRPILAHKFWDSMIFWRMKIKQTPISDFFLFNSGIKRSFMEYFCHIKYCNSQK